MSINLLDLLKDQVGDSISQQASAFLGENSSNVQSAMDGIFPTLLGTLVQKGSSESGASGLLSMLSDGGFDGNMLGNLAGLFGGGDSSSNLMNIGSGLVSSLLGKQSNGVIDMISSFAGIKKSSSSSLLNMAAPLIMSVIGKQVMSKGLNASSLMSLLLGQKNHIKSAMPSGLSGVGNLLGFGNLINQVTDTGSRIASNVGNTATKTAGAFADTAANTVNESKSMFSRILPLLLLAGLGLALWWFFTGNGLDKATDTIGDAATTVVEGAESAVETVSDVASDAANTVSDAASDVLDATTKAAREALSSVSFAAGSVGEKLSNLLSSNEEITENIRFNNLTFATGSANIQEDTKVEVDNLAAVLKAYPKVRIEVQGYTDNTGDATKNLELSQARAEAVVNQLKILGIGAGRLTAKGYGDANPVASNDTAEGRQQNRRIEVKVTK